MKNIWINGRMGVVVGDALGMQVQFIDRAELKNNPVETMRGYRTYNMPSGIWSDDSNMALATLFYGYDSVPKEWRKQIIKEAEIIALCESMEERFA